MRATDYPNQDYDFHQDPYQLRWLPFTSIEVHMSRFFSFIRRIPIILMSSSLIKNILFSGFGAVIGNMIGGINLAVILVCMTTFCEELFASLDSDQISIKKLFKSIKESLFKNQGIAVMIPNTNTDHSGSDSALIYQKEATVMFTDIRNFSAISEQMNPSDSFKLLKTYMNTMLPIINQNRGIVNQIMGDGILSIFHDSADQAIEAAIEMQQAIDKLNIDQNLSLRVGMGIATGTVVAGKLNCDKTGLFITSDTVNTAKRIEEMTKQFVSNILMCDHTVQQSSYIFKSQSHSLGELKCKGKKQRVHVHAFMPTRTNQSQIGNTIDTKSLKVA